MVDKPILHVYFSCNVSDIEIATLKDAILIWLESKRLSALVISESEIEERKVNNEK